MFQNEYIFHITQIRLELQQTEERLLFIDELQWLLVNLLTQDPVLTFRHRAFSI